MRADWGVMAEEYLANRDELALSIQLIDARHNPTELDLQLNEWLVYNRKNHIIVATKADKLSSNKLQKSLLDIKKMLPESKILTYSSINGKGKEQIWTEIGKALNNFHGNS